MSDDKHVALLLAYAAAAIFCGLLLRCLAQQADQDKNIIASDSKRIRLARWVWRHIGSGFAFWSIIYFVWHPEELSIVTIGLIVVADGILLIDSIALRNRSKPNRGKRVKAEMGDHAVSRQLRPIASFRRDREEP